MTLCPEPESKDGLLTTLCELGSEARTPAEFVATIGEHLGRSALKVERIFVGLQTSHPEFRARTYIWESSSSAVRTVEWPHGLANRPGYFDSPSHQVHTTGREYRVRDLAEAAKRSCDVYAELHASGHTDYLMLPLPFRGGPVNTLSITTRQPGGFPDGALASFRRCARFLTMALERLAALETVATILDTYLGPGISREVLRGRMRVGQGELIDGTILFADLHDFTQHAARLAPGETVRLLNSYFDCLVDPIEARGGYVLKFIGDAVLAFFPAVGEGVGPDPIEAVRDIEHRLRQLNAQRGHRGEPRLRHGVCLHHGRVVFGNVGSSKRLDFTIIGEDVNVAARCLEEDRHLIVGVLLTEPFVEAVGADEASLVAEVALRGVARPIRLYTLQASIRDVAKASIEAGSRPARSPGTKRRLQLVHRNTAGLESA